LCRVVVSALATIYNKIKLWAHQTFSSGDVRLPEQEMQTADRWRRPERVRPLRPTLQGTPRDQPWSRICDSNWSD
jgi:hypothetical protein